ncbi:uncharacterized protein [Procambarus clarkii]|uniref:uncharacterized protein n=1 Tax=Procambarus clarkii TaxID=6728 RepID=UPI001E677BD7|nr:uncharacterized protein LOC123769807 [Procambarus clarkii]
MEPTIPTRSKDFENAMDFLKNRMGPKGSISMFLVPRTPTKMHVKDKKSQGENVTANKSTGNALEKSLDDGVHICGEVITIQEASASTSMNPTSDKKCAQLSENADLDEDDTNHSTLPEQSSPQAIAVSTSTENGAGGGDILSSPTLKRIKASNQIVCIYSDKDAMSVENNVSTPTKDKTAGKNINLNDCPKQILSSHSPQKQHNGTDRDPQRVGFSCRVSPIKNVINKTTTDSLVSSGEQFHDRSKNARKLLESSKDPGDSISTRSVSYNLRQSRQQPLRFNYTVPTHNKQVKVLKTQKRKTFSITLPSLSPEAENNLLRIFFAMANFHGCEVTIDGRSVNVPTVRVQRRSQVYSSRKQVPSQHLKENLHSDSQHALSQNVSYTNKNDVGLFSLYPEVVLCTPHQM